MPTISTDKNGNIHVLYDFSDSSSTDSRRERVSEDQDVFVSCFGKEKKNIGLVPPGNLSLKELKQTIPSFEKRSSRDLIGLWKDLKKAEKSLSLWYAPLVNLSSSEELRRNYQHVKRKLEEEACERLLMGDQAFSEDFKQFITPEFIAYMAEDLAYGRRNRGICYGQLQNLGITKMYNFDRLLMSKLLDYNNAVFGYFQLENLFSDLRQYHISHEHLFRVLERGEIFSHVFEVLSREARLSGVRLGDSFNCGASESIESPKDFNMPGYIPDDEPEGPRVTTLQKPSQRKIWQKEYEGMLLTAQVDSKYWEGIHGYRKATLYFHPDLNKSPDSENQFKRLTELAELLEIREI